MKPSDCISNFDVTMELNESGISFNQWGITVVPMSVQISNSACTMKIPMAMFRRFAEWYLEDQKVEGD